VSGVRRILAGAAIAAAYVAVALWLPGATSRPLYDITGPQPYHWVKPPPEFAPTNQKAESGSLSITLTSAGSDAATISTADAQASLIVKEATFAPRAGESKVVAKIEALDPATLGVGPPADQRFDGNAYRIVAAYRQSGAEAKFQKPGTIVLQFPLLATKLLRLDGTTWTDLKATPVTAQLQIFSNTDRVGTFVATGPPIDLKGPKKKSFPTALVISLGAAVTAVVAGLFARMRAQKRKPAKPVIKRPPPGSRPSRR